MSCVSAAGLKNSLARMVQALSGVITNPLSLVGLFITFIYLLVAALSPVLAPPVSEVHDPYLNPARWIFARNLKRPAPFGTGNHPLYRTWYKVVTGKD